MDPSDVKLLKTFVQLLKNKPSTIELPELCFFKEWLLSLGAKLPDGPSGTHVPEEPHVTEVQDAEESPESDIEFEDTDILPMDDDPQQEMGDDNLEVTEEMSDESDAKHSEARKKMSECDFESAIKLLTEAIKLNPAFPLLYARRANCFVKLKKPCAAIRDCDKAISLNPDSAQPYKWRGFANRLIGQWEKAYEDLQISLRLDYSDDAYEAMKEIEPKHKRIFEHKMKYARKHEEKANQDRRERVRKAQEEHERARQESHTDEGQGDMFSKIFSDPDLLEAMKDPTVMKAFQEVSSNPAAMFKYKDNPKVQSVLKKMQEQFGGMSGDEQAMPGGMPFGMGGPGFTVPGQAAPDLD